MPPSVSLEPVAASTPDLVLKAQTLAVAGYPVIGNPVAASRGFDRNGGAIVLLAYAGDTPVGVIALDPSGPSRRIPSAKVIALSVYRGVQPEQIGLVAEFLLHCAPIFLEAGIKASGGRGGYIVTDIKTDNTYAALLANEGWQQLQQPAGSPAARFVKYLEVPDARPSRQSDEWS